MRWRNARIVAFDTETTGLNPAGGDRIIEFAAVLFEFGPTGRLERSRDVQHLVNPGVPIPKKVTEITGISDEDVAGAPRFADIAATVEGLLAGAVAVAHNFPFDQAMITAELRREGRNWPEPMAEVDTVDLSIRTFPDAKGHRLADLCGRLDVPLEGWHRAVHDAAATGTCFARLVERADLADDLMALQAWAGATGWPPEDGPIVRRDGRAVFEEGPKAGKPIYDHPLHLAWMEHARRRVPQGWQHRYPESTRAWIQRTLQARGTGRANQSPKSFHALDWVTDSCALVDRPLDPRLRDPGTGR